MATGGNIDEVSRTLGALQAQAAAAAEDRRVIAANVDRVDGKLDELKEQVGDVVSEIRRGLLAVPSLEQRVGKLEEQVDGFRIIKISAMVLWAAVTGAGALLLSNWKTVAGWFKG